MTAEQIQQLEELTKLKAKEDAKARAKEQRAFKEKCVKEFGLNPTEIKKALAELEERRRKTSVSNARTERPTETNLQRNFAPGGREVNKADEPKFASRF